MAMFDLAEPGARTRILDLFGKACAAAPGDVALARRFAQACATGADSARAVAAWKGVLANEPLDADAWAELAAHSWMIGAFSGAVEAARQAVAIRPDCGRLHGILGYAFQTTGALDAADDAYRTAYALDPSDGRAARGVGQGLIRRRAGVELARLCEVWIERFGPVGWVVSQRCVALALLGRAAEVGRLLDYDRLLHEEMLETPAGFASLDSFNTALTAELRTLDPIDSGIPAFDVVRDGQRASGGPLAAIAALGVDKAPASVALMRAFTAACEAHERRIAASGDDLFARMKPSTTTVRTEGLITRRQAYVAPHMHAASWLSAVYYAAVPKPETLDGNAGCLNFAPPLHKVDLPDGIWPTRLIRPTAGLFVLFPGYAYHGAYATISSDDRIVVTFDVVPGDGTGKDTPAPSRKPASDQE